jgi:vesicle transport through interaction with t-SNAREs protein 1
MSQTYEDYERDYVALLSRVRSFLAASRSRSSLLECERLLEEARKCAVAMRGLAEISGDAMRIQQAEQRSQRDIAPLSREVSSALDKIGNVTYQAPSDVEYGNLDTQRLISQSEELLRESQALCASSEQIGNETLGQMGRQREQLEATNQYLHDTSTLTGQARQILQDMQNKTLRKKSVLYALIVLLIIANAWAIHHLWVKGKHSNNTAPNDTPPNV